MIGHHEERDRHDLGKLFWREEADDPETDGAAPACELTAVDAFFYAAPHRRGRVGLVGLRFRYARGVRREVGCCTTAAPNTTMESVEIGGDEIAYLERREDEWGWHELDKQDEHMDDWDKRNARQAGMNLAVSLTPRSPYFSCGTVGMLHVRLSFC